VEASQSGIGCRPDAPVGLTPRTHAGHPRMVLAGLPAASESGTQPRLRSAAGAGGAGLHPVRQRGMGEDLAAKSREEEGVKVCKTRMR